MNKLFSIILVVLLACGAALWFLAAGSLNEYVKQQIETVGHELTEQTVSVASVDIRLTEGAGEINGFSIANPKVYQYAHAMSLGKILLDINVKSLTSDVIVIDEILIKDPQLFVELTENGQSNIKDLLDTINKKSKTNISKETKEEPSAENTTEPNIRISKVSLLGASLQLDLRKLGNKEHQKTLTDITLTNIGGDKGLPASELATELVSAILKKVVKEVKNTQKEELKSTLINKAKKKLTDLFN